jgi:hypothetical protein
MSCREEGFDVGECRQVWCMVEEEGEGNVDMEDVNGGILLRPKNVDSGSQGCNAKPGLELEQEEEEKIGLSFSVFSKLGTTAAGATTMMRDMGQ